MKVFQLIQTKDRKKERTTNWDHALQDDTWEIWEHEHGRWLMAVLPCHYEGTAKKIVDMLWKENT